MFVHRSMFVDRKQWLFSSVCVDDIKMVGKKQNMAPMWKKMMRNMILTNQHHFLTIYFWNVLNVNTKLMKQLLNDKQVFE